MSLCNITGTIVDSGGNTLDGELRVIVGTQITDTDTTPDTVIVPRQFAFTIISGNIDINLHESETQQITYLFEFWPVNAETDTGFDNQPAISFNAMVPNQAEEEFINLIPTGITTDTLDTAIARIARVIITNSTLLDTLAQAVAPYITP